MLLLCVLLPLIGSLAIFALRLKSRAPRSVLTECFVLATSVLTMVCVFGIQPEPVTLLRITDRLTLTLRMDGLGRVFSGLVAFLWPLATLYAFEYMKHEERENAFFGYYTLSYAVTLGVAMAGNLLTLYVFYELLTLSTLPLVMHGMGQKRVFAGRKYAYYSLGGAAMAFMGMMIVMYYSAGSEFTYGGVIDLVKAAGQKPLLLVAYALCFFGFGVKAAVVPLQGWLPTASIAPTPVTALLHAVAVVKAGVFSVMRATYFIFGVELLRGTWAQTLGLSIALITILFGSVMAVKEQHLKRRLAYSTISNLSYVLFGALLMTPEGLTAGLMHMVFHALMKLSLFSCVGAIMVQTGKSYLQDMRGFAKRMPFIYAVFTFCAISLVGIPPMIGFQSKWALATAGYHSGQWLGYAGMGVLILSAVLTAIYLLIPVISAYFQPLNEDCALEARSYDPGPCMRIALIVLCAAMLLLAFGSAPLWQALSQVAQGLL